MAPKAPDYCTGCGKPKSPDTFGSFVPKRGPDAGTRRLRTKCNECTAAYKRQWYAKNPENVRISSRADYQRAKRKNPLLNRERELRRHYGMTLAEYDAICESQGGLCAACHQPPSGGRWIPSRLVVDHCHRSGQVRQLLCYPCNAALGMVGDNLDRLRMLLDYLERNR